MHFLLQNSNLFRLPDIILIAQQTISRFCLADQGQKITGRSQMLSLFITEKESTVAFSNALKQIRGCVFGSVVLHQHEKIRIGLGKKRVQQFRQMAASVVCG